MQGEGIAISKPEDVVKDPYVLEFLDLPDADQPEYQVRKVLESSTEGKLLYETAPIVVDPLEEVA